MNVPSDVRKACDLEKGDKFIMFGKYYKVCYVGVEKINYRQFYPDNIGTLGTTTHSFGRKSQQKVELLKPK